MFIQIIEEVRHEDLRIAVPYRQASPFLLPWLFMFTAAQKYAKNTFSMQTDENYNTYCVLCSRNSIAAIAYTKEVMCADRSPGPLHIPIHIARAIPTVISHVRKMARRKPTKAARRLFLAFEKREAREESYRRCAAIAGTLVSKLHYRFRANGMRLWLQVRT